MPDAQKLPDNDPRIVAWEAYKQTEEYANTQRWASAIDHTEGSLWAAFLEGWTRAATAQAVTLTEEERLVVVNARNTTIYGWDVPRLIAIIDRITNGASTP